MSRGVSEQGIVAILLVFILTSTAVAVTLTANSQGAGQSIVSINDEPMENDGTTRSMTYRIYDMFEEEWGEWWTDPYWGRLSSYDQSLIISADEGRSTMLYMSGYRVGTGPAAQYQGLIYAPYRWSMEGISLPELTVTDPEFMPIRGPSTVAGTPSVSLDLYFQYLYPEWWDGYWIPTWSGTDGWSGDDLMYSGNDGYYIGTTYDIVLNRPAAEVWLNMPQTSDPLAWWTANKANYLGDWQTWMDDQGNNVFDIWCAFLWPYIDLATMMDLTVDGEGNIILSIGHINWGYEVLMCRWLDDAGLCDHQPWWEDFTMHIDYSTTESNMNMDAVAQYNLHAVRATNTVEDAAWVWEPSRIDYVTHLYHPSDYEPYEDLKYESANAGDNLIDFDVPYEVTPGWFNLSADEQLIIEFPKDECIGYKGVGTQLLDYQNLASGDASGFEEIMLEADTGLGHWFSGGYDIGACYNQVGKNLTIVGPVDFDNERWPGGQLYHGAPWIEMNVRDYVQPDPLPSVRLVMKPGCPQLSSEVVDFIAPSSGILTVEISNEGLRRIVFEVYDCSDGLPELVFREVCNLKTTEAYPAGSIDLQLLGIVQGNAYEVLITPGGDDGTYTDLTFGILPDG